MALVAMLYIPCVSTVAILAKNSGWKAATVITLATLGGTAG
jgi:ferrous iron transport protein B